VTVSYSRRCPVLGAGDHPTFTGVKVVIERDRVEEMTSAPGAPYYDVMVPWSLRLTNSGEFAHDTSWNHNIGAVNTSHGCTNLRPGDAQWFYGVSQIGDVLTYPNATGMTMPVWDGYGDGNVRGRCGAPVTWPDRRLASREQERG